MQLKQRLASLDVRPCEEYVEALKVCLFFHSPFFILLFLLHHTRMKGRNAREPQLTNSSVRKTTMLSNTLPKDPSITSGQVHTTSPKLMIYTEGLTPSSLKHSLSLDDWCGKDLGLGYMLFSHRCIIQCHEHEHESLEALIVTRDLMTS
jgi:hypothetical protein